MLYHINFSAKLKNNSEKLIGVNQDQVVGSVPSIRSNMCSFTAITSNQNLNHNIFYKTMVDRYKSLLGGQPIEDQLPRNALVGNAHNHNHEIILRTNSHATKMRELITKYKRNVGNDGAQIINDFKQEQGSFARDRNILKLQLDKLQKAKKDTPEYNFMKKQLLRAIKSEIDLQLELNQEVSRQKEQKQKWKDKHISGSPLLTNALKDIQAKRADILYLEKQINECLKLLEMIGILTNETGEKLDSICNRVKTSRGKYDKAKIAIERSRCKMCCIILLALIVIGI